MFIIQPNPGFFNIGVHEIWQYRDLYSMFVKRDLITQYKQTILGPVWFLVQPTLTTVLYCVVFGGFAGISTNGLPPALFYLAGIIPWQYFADCLLKISSTFTANQAIFGKVYFPRIIVPLSIISSNLLRSGIQLVLFAIVYWYYVLNGMPLNLTVYLLSIPLLFCVLAGLALGFGVLIASMTAKYRDLTILFGFILQLWMFATPVIYPLSSLSVDQQALLAHNPVASIIETFRTVTLGVGTVNMNHMLYSISSMLVLLLVGSMVFTKVQRSFMDTI